ncbi:MAG: hypothetical protein JWP01_3017, partial [Myxococcales bacterium]|nr:hypothetical protein [Myxococcales bacterium]
SSAPVTTMSIGSPGPRCSLHTSSAIDSANEHPVTASQVSRIATRVGAGGVGRGGVGLEAAMHQATRSPASVHPDRADKLPV